MLGKRVDRQPPNQKNKYYLTIKLCFMMKIEILLLGNREKNFFLILLAMFNFHSRILRFLNETISQEDLTVSGRHGPMKELTE